VGVVLTFPLQVASSDILHVYSEPQFTDTAIAAPIPQKLRIAIAT
jgi:hypothetical protein